MCIRDRDKVSALLVNKSKKIAVKMLSWLKIMSHNDGEISFFNDATFGITPKNAIVFEYATKLGIHAPIISPVLSEDLTVFNLKDSGYVIVKSGEYSLISDLAKLGPDYQPAHAHADTLSYEFSLAGQRIFVNSGTSEYGLSKERLRQRGTAAHNTVIINNQNSSQVWSGFRVAKRANVLSKNVNSVVNNSVSFSAEHDGFKKQGVNCIHHRDWFVTDKSVTITDKLIGKYTDAIGFLHLHPNIDVVNVTDEELLLESCDYYIFIRINGANVSVENSTWHPEFGVSLENTKLQFSFSKSIVSTVITWEMK